MHDQLGSRAVNLPPQSDRPATVPSKEIRTTGPPRLEVPNVVDILDGVLAAARRGTFESNAQAGVLLDAVVDGVRCILVLQHAAERMALTPREKQIAVMVANGHTNHAIASALEISVWTVSTHLRRVFAKLAVTSRAEMVAILAQWEVVVPEFSDHRRPP